MGFYLTFASLLSAKRIGNGTADLANMVFDGLKYCTSIYDYVGHLDGDNNRFITTETTGTIALANEKNINDIDEIM